MSERNIQLDLIKSLACICVVGLHAVGMSNYTLYYLFDCGVPLFLMVNGYLLLSRQKVDYSYAFQKMLHILKIVFFWNLLIAVPVFLFRHKFVNPFRLSYESLLQQGYLWHFWFFGTLLILYLFLPILHRLFVPRPVHHFAGCLLLMSVCLCMSFLSMLKSYPIHMYIPQPLRLWTWLFYFLAGGLFSYIPSRLERVPLKLHGLLLLGLTILNNVAEKKIGLYLIGSRLAEYFYDDLTSILWYTVLFTFLLRLPVKKSLYPIITGFSKMSLGIFILHPIFLTAIGSRFTPSGTTHATLYWIFLTLVSLAATAVISRLPLAKKLVRL